MAIEQLGESLLSQARDRKKKEKKKAKIFTGLMLGVQLGNVALRKRAEKRANEFWNSNQGLLNQRTSQLEAGVDWQNTHRGMLKKYGKYEDTTTGENWTSAFDSMKLEQYQSSPEYKDVYRNNPQEFNKKMQPKLLKDREGYRQELKGYSEFKNITSVDKETKTAYEKPLRDKLQKAVDIINRQDNVGGWLFNKVGLRPSAELVPLKDKKGNTLTDNEGNVTMVPEGLGGNERNAIIDSVEKTMTNWNTIQNAVGVKQNLTNLEMNALVPKFIPSMTPDKELIEINNIAQLNQNPTENLKQENFKIKLGSEEIGVSEFLNQFEISDKFKGSNVYLTETQKTQVYQDALAIADYKYKIFKAEVEKTPAGALAMPDGGKLKFYKDALQEVILKDFTYEIGKDPSKLGFGADEARGIYKRTTRNDFLNSIIDKDIITIPDSKGKDLEISQGSIDSVLTDEDLKNEKNNIIKFTTPDEVINNFKTTIMLDPNFNNASGEIKAGVIKGILLEYPEMSSPLSTMFVDILTQQDMMQRGQVDASKVTDMKQRGEVDNTKVTTLEENPSLLSPSGRLSAEEMNRRMDEGAARMAEGSVSLAQIFRADKESTKKRVIKKAEKYLENPQSSVGFRSNLFTKWVEETKGIKTYQIKKEDKPEAVEEFLEFLNQ
tara:strand:+ start:2527 stop:4512 length:1986 start_codon:yes stop_codon:yes gene_type:complete